MFWGLIMEPNKRYTQVVEKPFHISHAALDHSTGDNDPCQVMVVVDGKNFLICTLRKTEHLQVSLDLYFKTGDSVSFLTNGKCNVHLTGYLDPEFEDDVSDEEDEAEDEEEVPELVPAKNKRKLENSIENNISKKSKPNKKGQKVEETDSSDSEIDDDDDDTLKKFLDGEDMETDESFKLNSSADASDSDGEEEEEEEDDDDEEVEEDDESSNDADTTANSSLDVSNDKKSLDLSNVDMSKLTKSQRKRLKKKLQKQGQEQPKVNGIVKPKKDSSENEQKEKKKQNNKKEVAANDVSAAKKEKKSLKGGVSIEDLKVGDGPLAKPGKVVMVYYEGRLKQNNKMFDQCQKGPGFKFHLGAKEVISGWDVGVAGMKVGGRRRITCPPAMAYGAKGSPPVVPPNATLVFEVELKNIK